MDFNSSWHGHTFSEVEAAIKAAMADKQDETIPFTNPVGPWCPDPCIWKGDDGCFYVKGTGRLNTVKRTSNFVDWEDTGRTFISQSAQEWLFSHYGHYATDDDEYELHPHQWAPFVIKIGTNWVMYMAIVEREGAKSAPVETTAHIVAFTSRTPYGDFGNPVTIVSDGEIRASAASQTKWNNVIDPFVYCDPYDNKLYLLAGSSAAIRRAQLADDGLSLTGRWALHVAGHSTSTDPTRETVYEGAYLYSRAINGVLYDYLFVSSGDYADRDYCVKVGRCPRGNYLIGGTSIINFRAKDDNIMRYGYAEAILTTESDTSEFWGPGHVGGIFETEDGKTWMLYHCHCGDGYLDRKLFIQELLWDEDGWPYFENDGHPVGSGTISRNVTSSNTEVTVPMTVDNEPVEESTNPVSSGGVKRYTDDIVGDIENLLSEI